MQKGTSSEHERDHINTRFMSSTAENALRLISFFVVIVSLLGIVIAITTSMDARRREIALLRAIGMSGVGVAMLTLLEAFFLSLLGCVAAVVFKSALMTVGSRFFEAELGMSLQMQWWSAESTEIILVCLVAGVLMGLLPAFATYRSSLQQGLSPRL
jgi:putative ABC transport system permease protein